MSETVDFLIVGSGIAGLRAAIELADAGNVLVLTKARPTESNTEYAQGGVAVALSDEDEIGLHYRDTIEAGDGLCEPEAVRVLVEEGPQRIRELIDWGAEFDREGTKLAFTREAAHSQKRILHAGGDSTGREINRTLFNKLHSLDRIRLCSHAFCIDLLVEKGVCRGLTYWDSLKKRVRRLRAAAVLLATGGMGVLYEDTTNPDVATGDGCAIAFRAGASLSDLEFVQFHPTALKAPGAPRFLLSEALRGEGAYLRNNRGERFMERYHRLAELAPRDVVSRSIFTESHREQQERVFLDLRHLDSKFIRSRFPGIYTTCRRFGLDLTRDLMPVFPAAHYMMGGIETNLEGATTLPGLWAAGEAACNGVHGANRLASNSLLEGLVFGARAGQAMAADPLGGPRLESDRTTAEAEWPVAESESLDPVRLRRVMSRQVGIVRSAESLSKAFQQFSSTPFVRPSGQAGYEFNNLLTNARLVSWSALQRTESRGAHFRDDFPERDDRAWNRHSLLRWDSHSRRVIWSAKDARSAAGALEM